MTKNDRVLTSRFWRWRDRSPVPNFAPGFHADQKPSTTLQFINSQSLTRPIPPPRVRGASHSRMGRRLFRVFTVPCSLSSVHWYHCVTASIILLISRNIGAQILAVRSS